VAAAVLDAQQLAGALVELVVADAGVVEAGQAERLDGRLVAERRGQQRGRPIRSPAATVMVLFSFCCSASCASWVARYSTPPASTFTAVPSAATPVWMRPPEPVGASRLPWKSLSASSWTWTGFGPLALSAWVLRRRWSAQRGRAR
jgi:hypothetical protein